MIKKCIECNQKIYGDSEEELEANLEEHRKSKKHKEVLSKLKESGVNHSIC